MKNGRINGVSILISLALLCMGCRSRKEAVRGTWERDSLTIQHSDSLWRTRQWQTATAATIHWEEMTLTPPDSSGRQSVSRLQRAVVKHTNQAEARDTFYQQSKKQRRQLHEVTTAEQQQVTVNSTPVIRKIGVLLLIGFLLLLRFCQSS